MGSVNNITDFFHNSSLKINGIMTIKSNIEKMDDNASLEEQVKITIENLSSTLNKILAHSRSFMGESSKRVLVLLSFS